ncbi:MAG: hypothetical protein HY758_03010 [Nitrospirae bacterium]|nr:hypothetical protein [Nitrospirota bacterium]
MRFKDSGSDSTALLGKDGSHWSYLLDSDASVLLGNDWQDNKDGTFTSTGARKCYNSLDLYLMGMYDKTQVQPMLLIDNPLIDKTQLPSVGATITGTSRNITIDDIIASEGQRIPNASTSQKAFKTAFILITRPGTYNSSVLPGIENIRSAWAGRFAQLTYGKGTIMDVTPSITLAIGTPSNGATINKPSVTVKGAVINNTGNETGVIVNGIPANAYGTQFIANNVPLTGGSNTITATATDTAGNTATTSITVNAVTSGNYIKLSSNIESGISPLEVTLKIDGSFSIDASSMSASGPLGIEWLSSSYDEYRVRMTAEGIYNVTASSTDPLGVVQQDSIQIIVQNKNQLDILLKAKWEGMKTALASQDVAGAVGYFTDETKQTYSEILTVLSDQLPQLVQNMQDIQLIYSTNNAAKYRIRRNENYNGQTITITYYIYFSRDKDGIWKIYQY